MKILFTSNLFPPETQGGYELRLFYLLHELNKEHDCVVVTSDSGDGACKDEEGVRVHRVLSNQNPEKPTLFSNLDSIFKDQREAITFSEILDEERPDHVVHFNLAGISPSILSVPQLLGIPQSLWVEDVWMNSIQSGKNSILHPWYQVHQESSEGKFAKIAPLIRPFLSKNQWITKNLKLASQIHAANGLFVSHFQEWKNRNKSFNFDQKRVIQSGIPVFEAAKSESSLHFHDSIRLICASALTPDRGFDVLFEALSLLTEEQRSRFKLTLAGKPPNKWGAEWWKNFREEHKNSSVWNMIEQVGWISSAEMQNLLSKQDVLIFPSTRGEGMPLIMQEAMLSGCLVISSGSGGAGELCSEAGLPISPANCPAALKNMLLSLLSDLENATEKRAQLRDFARSHFDIRECAKTLVRYLARKE